MKKANNQEELKPAAVLADPNVVEALKQFFIFPIDVEGRKLRENRNRLDNLIRHRTESVEDAKRAIVGYRQEIKDSVIELAKLPELPPVEEPNAARVMEQMAAIGKLPWVETVSFDFPTLRIQTRKGMLKTLLSTRLVDCGGGRMKPEYLAEPVWVPMPQYEFNINPEHMGRPSWANNANYLGIRLIDKHDASKFIAGKILVHEPHAHWASNGGRRVGDWESLCLGEYENELAEASKEGFVPFLTVLAHYLQTCGDSHAFRSKQVWAACLGKPEYNDHVYRLIANKEQVTDIEARYKRDYKTMNAVEFSEGAEVNPGANGVLVPEIGLQDLVNAEINNLARNVIRMNRVNYFDGLMQPGGLMAVAAGMDDLDECDCEDCDDDCECACHE